MKRRVYRTWVLVLLAPIPWAFIFNLVVEKQRQLNEAAVLRILREVATGQEQHSMIPRETNTPPPYPFLDSLELLGRAGLVSPELGSTGEEHGYRFEVRADGSRFWELRATPRSRWAGRRNFYVCTDGIVRFAEGGERADASTPPVPGQGALPR